MLSKTFDLLTIQLSIIPYKVTGDLNEAKKKEIQPIYFFLKFSLFVVCVLPNENYYNLSYLQQKAAFFLKIFFSQTKKTFSQFTSQVKQTVKFKKTLALSSNGIIRDQKNRNQNL